MSNFKVGWSEKSILKPGKKIALAGQLYERIAKYVESDITATALAIDTGDDAAIFVSLDIAKISDELMKSVREIFATLNSEVDPLKIMINATHVHTAMSIFPGGSNTIGILNEFMPDGKSYKPLCDKSAEDVLSVNEALEFVSHQVAYAANEAWQNRKKAGYVNAFGRAAIGFCRRASYNDGTSQMWGDTNTANFVALEGGNDSGIELIYFFNESKMLTGVVANIACPAQILEHQDFVSSDYWGKAKEYIRKKLGDNIYLLALCGAGGDQCPRDLIRWVHSPICDRDPHINRPNYIERVADPSMFDLEGCRLAGKRIANEIISVYEELGEIKEDAELIHRSYVLDMPLRKVTNEQYADSVRQIEYYMTKNKDKEIFNYEDNAAVYVYAGNINRYRVQQNMETFPIEVHTLRFGDVAFTTNPFELYLDYGNRIKARSKAKQTFIVQLSCGGRSYLPTEKAEKAGHYSAYVTSGFTGHEGGDILTRKAIDEINNMF